MKNALLILTTFVSISVFGQNDFILRERQQIECSNAAKKNSLYFVEFMRENSIKSAKFILNQWEATCGLNEPVFNHNKFWTETYANYLSRNYFGRKAFSEGWDSFYWNEKVYPFENISPENLLRLR